MRDQWKGATTNNASPGAILGLPRHHWGSIVTGVNSTGGPVGGVMLVAKQLETSLTRVCCILDKPAPNKFLGYGN